MHKYLLFFLCLFFYGNSHSQSLYFPPLAASEWETVSPDELGWCSDKIDSLLNYLEENNSKAFIVLKDGKIVIEKYFGTFVQDSLWYWASAGKTLTAFMVGIAQQEDFLQIEDTSSEYLGTGWTNCTTEQEEKITIRNQLTMTTGLDDGVSDNHCFLDTCLNYIADAGTRWAYHNAPYTLLDSVIYYATGENLNGYINDKLKTQTGMTGFFFLIDYDNIFFSTARSMARFGLLLLNKGNWNGNQILTDTAYYNAMVNSSQALNESYGYLCWLNGKSSYMVPTLQYVFPGKLLPHAPDDVIAALGKNGQIINIDPANNLVLIRMGNASAESEVTIQLNDTIWQKLNAVICSGDEIISIKNLPDPRIYPNPANQFCTVTLPDTYFSLGLTDVSGKVIQLIQNCYDKATISTVNFPAGIYFIKLITSEGLIYNENIFIER